ncbi:DUF92 domain-containing protein [Cytobacillus dafuensis]|uniref:DUF92 domain-containing protein n=1 Tax=Cytobacillus dafuensis TaxID=1742359 RepID=A0A5B8Z6J4_CYTDA|nr:DUF92 domain-containing protein [Cytobacillus dafuensis]QED48634.1 DUF92 domain-containing protein [Cytobacillus dafuensis]
MIEVIFLILFIGATSVCGYFLKLLTKSGSIAALIVGLTVGLSFGVEGLLLLGFFFASSSFWSKYKRKNKINIENRHEKGSRRDWMQVAANGGTAAFISLLNIFFPDSIWIYGFSISIAAANSDTWASEIGSLSKRSPIYIRSFKRIEAGTSGAVSVLGTFAAICGAFSIVILANYFFHFSIGEMAIIFAFGFFGNVIDTLLGAFIQAVYKCEICGTEVEALHHCGAKTTHKRGVLIMNNDFVNFLSGFLAAFLGLLFIH